MLGGYRAADYWTRENSISQEHGSLFDLIQNRTVEMEGELMLSILRDVVQVRSTSRMLLRYQIYHICLSRIGQAGQALLIVTAHHFSFPPSILPLHLK